MSFKELTQDIKGAFTKQNFKAALQDKSLKYVFAVAFTCLAASATKHGYDNYNAQYDEWKKSQPQGETAAPVKPQQDHSVLRLN